MNVEKYRKVFIVDDSQMDGLLLKTILASISFAEEIHTYNCPLELLSYFEKNESSDLLPEIVFVDLNMPHLSGFQLIEALGSLQLQEIRRCKFVIVTSSDCREDIEKSATYPNVISYLIKPVHPQDFLLEPLKLKAS